MITQDTFNNIPSKNVVRDPSKKNLSESLNNSYQENTFSNMLLNSNLDNQSLIK